MVVEHNLRCLHDHDGRCAHAKRAGDATPSSCAGCPHYAGRARGLGDIVATAAKAVGIAPCGGCQKRREALNKAVPFPLRTQIPAQQSGHGPPTDGSPCSPQARPLE